jgi:putative transposase
MTIQRAYRTELDLNNVQRTLLLKHAGCARFAYNWGLARVKDQTTKPNAMVLHKELNALKPTDFPWMYEVSKCAMQEALRDLQRAFVNFFEGRAKFPTFKSKNDGIGSFRLTGTVKVEGNRIQLPRLGWLRLKERGYIPQDAHILSATVSERAGRWFVSVLVKEEVEQAPLVNDVLGIDLGVKTLATCSDGTVYENPKVLAQHEEHLQRLQRKLSRQQKTSKRRTATKNRIARVWAKIRNVRKDGIQKATTDIVKAKRCRVVVLEDLNISGMVKNHCLAKSIHDAGMRQFRTTLEYKQAWAGGEIYLVDRWHPSSKTCSECGVVKNKLSLSERVFVCENCGSVMDRDLNAAVNLKLYTASSAGINGRGDAKVHRLATA